MTTTLDASNLTLNQVKALLKFQSTFNNSFTSLLTLEPLTESEQEELEEIRKLFDCYYGDGKISEGQIRFLFLAPLLRLAGFYIPRIKILLEEKIADILVEDNDRLIKGRMDILALNRQIEETEVTPFWVLVIETKNSSINALEGLPQLLTYAYDAIKEQSSVWGLCTNGMDYQFVYIQQANSPVYQLLPKLDITRASSSVELLQVLKAIRKQYFGMN
ncbi:hypothetical protein DSM106972_078320 [Dulcicalothrix desertica PCC 7102]|uniref:Restriction endonuclease subunit R n=1 Tax=Dulcicalothrix desertica PCC 7102 TaxID=232991 RepID=A0A3S1AUD1_9CYAN|nr:restriction endonuclease subunit R [Dulcicalothrix desertica]RUS99390.1 hypothetical protein DSM106972_078320 [Dulcicalothrix desertica PCC 7102]TWH50051.1 hypothetical protein CAL7102_04331 [Dulcicalothrix desertica PCC 7102]